MEIITMVAMVGYFGQSQAPLKEMSKAYEYETHSAEFYDDRYFGVAVRSAAKGANVFYNAKDDALAIFNGEVYNKDDLVGKLENKGQDLSAVSDAELFASLSKNLENKVLEEIRGKFSVAIFNQTTKRMTLVRDRFGQCSMYYTDWNDSLLFSSEIRSILAFKEINREVDRVSLGYHLSFGYTPAPRTIFKGIYKLPPACILKVSLGKRLSMDYYWNMADLNERRICTQEALVKDVYQQIMDSVKIRSTDAKNAGVLLSGGLDSGTITAFLKKILGDRVSTFSMVYEDTYQNEVRNIEKIVEYLGVDHHIKFLKSDAIDENLIRRIVELYGEPCAHSSVVSSFFASKFAKEHVPIVFTGDGGDEAFLGYLSVCWKEPVVLEYYSRLGSTAKLISFLMTPVLQELTRRFDDRRLAMVLDFFERESMYDRDPQVRFAARHLVRYFAPERLVELGFSPDTGSDGYNLVKDLFSRTTRNLVAKKNLAIININLVADAFKNERSSAAFSMKMRSPLLDHKLMEFALSIPVSLRFKNNVTKYLLRKMLLVHKMLPREIVTSTSKRGFEAPVEIWLKKDLKGLARTKLVEEKPSILKGFSKQHVEKLLKRNDRYSALKVWNLLLLSIWYDIFIREQRS